MTPTELISKIKVASSHQEINYLVDAYVILADADLNDRQLIGFLTGTIRHLSQEIAILNNKK